jgi:cytidylate kinase
VSSRSERTLAARTVRHIAGIETIINSILVRGEDDRPRQHQPLPANQTA